MSLFSLLQENFIKSRKKYFGISLFVICNLYFTICNSQDFLGYTNSPFSGVNGIDLNPACIVNNPRKWDVSVIGLNVGVANNFIGFQKKALNHTGGLTSGNYPAFNDNNFANDYLTQRMKIKAASVFVAANISLPSFMFTREKHKDAFAFTCRTRAYVNVDGIDPSLAHMMVAGATDSTMFGNQLSSPKLSTQTMVWTEYGVTYGKTIMESSNGRLNVAGRLKLLQGLYAAYIYIDNVDYKFNTSDSLLIISPHVNYGHSKNLEFSKNALKFGFGGKPSVGLDIGATYEFHPIENTHSKKVSQSTETMLSHEYRYKVGFSVQDLGWITYLKPSNGHDFTAEFNNTINLSSLSTPGSTPLASADDTLKKKFSMLAVDKKFRMNLPTMVSVQGDYYVGKNISVNSTMNYAFQFKNNEDKIHEVTAFSITPRWDWKWLGTYFPVSYNKYSHVRAGFSLRLGPLIVGTSNVLPLITKKDVYGLDFHFLLKVPHIAFNKKNKNSKSKSRFNKNKEGKRRKHPKSDMPAKDSEHKVRKHIFPKIHFFKKKKRNANPEDEDHTIYFKI
ncbi:MAG: hypothetical protein HY840_07240 [Bacteroidetes bacterium]|nr:hypothetical protein [Bacteroidota bacterium]